MSTASDTLFKRHRLKVQDYLRMADAGILHEDDRVELIGGEIVDIAPTGNQHAIVVSHLHRLFLENLRETAVLWNQSTVVLGEESALEPDIALLIPPERRYFAEQPSADDVLLVVEVADSSLRYDREVKLPVYARHGIPEVWLVDLPAGILRLYRSPTQRGYAEESITRERVTPVRFPQTSIDVVPLFKALSA